jgi:hypothetical protein
MAETRQNPGIEVLAVNWPLTGGLDRALISLDSFQKVMI